MQFVVIDIYAHIDAFAILWVLPLVFTYARSVPLLCLRVRIMAPDKAAHENSMSPKNSRA
jgi:hypothetical protein